MPGFALITAPIILTFLFTGRDAAITANSVKNRNHAVMSFSANRTVAVDAVRSAITATAELLVFCPTPCIAVDRPQHQFQSVSEIPAKRNTVFKDIVIRGEI